MDTKTQSLPNTHTQPHSNSRPQSHACNQCSCSHHCQSRGRSRSCCCRSRSRSHSRNSSRRPRSHRSPAGHQGSGPSPPLRRHRYTMHSHQGPSWAVTHSCSHSKNRKNLEGKVIKRKQVKRSKQVYKRKRQSSGRKYN